MHLSLSALLLILATAGPSAAATVCNGYSEYCDRLFSNVTIVGAHNSFSASNTNLAANQDYGVTQQLTDGIRLLQNQVHLNNGVLELCHTSCLLYDGGSLEDYLTKVKTWLEANPNEVVAILFANNDDQPASSFASVYQAVGIDSLSWTPPAGTIQTDAWPTLGSLIDAGTRLITLMDFEADFASVPYIIDEFSNMWEGPFDITDPSGFNCTINRSSGDTTGQMYLINHYLDTISNFLGGTTPVPDKAALLTTNGVSGPGSLGQEAEQTCPPLHARPPTFLLVDFYDWGQGSVFEVAATLNGVQYQAQSIAPQNGTDGTTSSSSGGATSTKNAATTSFGIALSAGPIICFALVLASMLAV